MPTTRAASIPSRKTIKKATSILSTPCFKSRYRLTHDLSVGTCSMCQLFNMSRDSRPCRQSFLRAVPLYCSVTCRRQHSDWRHCNWHCTCQSGWSVTHGRLARLENLSGHPIAAIGSRAKAVRELDPGYLSARRAGHQAAGFVARVSALLNMRKCVYLKFDS